MRSLTLVVISLLLIATLFVLRGRHRPVVDTFAMPEEVLPLEAFQRREELLGWALRFLEEEYPNFVQVVSVQSCDLVGDLKEAYFQSLKSAAVGNTDVWNAGSQTWSTTYGAYECFISSEQEQAEVSLRRQLRLFQRFVTYQAFKDLQATVKTLQDRIERLEGGWSAVIPLTLKKVVTEGFVSPDTLLDANGQPVAALDADVETMTGPMLLRFTDACLIWLNKTTLDPLMTVGGRLDVLRRKEPSVRIVGPPAPAPVPAPGPAPVSSIPSGCVNIPWKYDKGSNIITGPYTGCTTEDASQPWCMKPAYISGGTQNVHWKYTSDPNDPTCLTNWTYYDSDGNILASNIPRTTTQGDTRPWCALPVYKRGGTQDKAWQSCSSAPAVAAPA